MTPLSLRPARASDVRLLYEWANDPAVRAVAYHPDPIPWPDHQAWFARRLASDDARLYVAEVEAEPVGQIRFDLDGPTAVLSVSLAAGARGQGLGTALIRAGVARVYADADVREVRAYVRDDNPASARAFEKAGFALARRLVEQDVPSRLYVDRRGLPAPPPAGSPLAS